MRRTLATLAAVLPAMAAGPANAWAPEGHMAVGAIADGLLAGTNAGRQSRKILGSTLRTASVWADCAKGVDPKTFRYAGAGRFAECAVYENAASEKLMESFVKRNVKNCAASAGSEICHKQYHYADVAIQRERYERGQVGTSDHDIVAAVTAAMAVLQGKPAPAPFDIATKKEALRLLAHYVGDIHQPLHVAAVYLENTGKVVDPLGAGARAHATHGGNDLLVGAANLHGQWDSTAGAITWTVPGAAVLARARALPPTDAAPAQWSSAWATETLSLGKVAFEGITYGPADGSNRHRATLPQGYAALKARIQRDQVERAGARLAQTLRAVWPD